MPEIAPEILKKTVIQTGIHKGRIRNSAVAHEEANSILELIGRASSEGYTIDSKAKKSLNKRTGDYLITAQAGKTVHAEQSAEKFQKWAIRDTLTGLFSRRYFFEQMHEEISRAKRSNIPIGVAFGDVRKLKFFNDTYGHETGDEVLKGIAQSIKHATLRESDIPCRLGGDENVVIYPVLQPDTQRKTSYNIKDDLVFASARMVREVHSQKMIMPDASIAPLYMDTGVTLSVPSDTTESILRRLGQAAYLAKKFFHGDEDKVVIATWTHEGTLFEVAEIVEKKVIYSGIPKKR